ncbi:hypothetical protein ELH73_16705 [Rhizobium leguminosarum]|uniref:Uncharacterized protein n=1 Tax=Rhizobium leguminosarum TaxID=384 RepID=A0ABD7PV03_RHILE|nr:hypothetical protein ELI28_16740 [Rhizobium leguminosarum]TAV79664.1 hypothetical protein ELI27_16725 [Rhizobium leguminosarum]TAW31000.1 hypothetical protein ELI19_16495 [Rhizobium leguminosarum]TAW44727.1 hypothetical protein ELI18_16450 [Rhizobium leguminosarum]TAX35886.1 hypothetical protein ELI06_16955 [Rhizobium leguminosarum]
MREAQNRSNLLFLRSSGRKTASRFSWNCFENTPGSRQTCFRLSEAYKWQFQRRPDRDRCSSGSRTLTAV